MENDIKVVFDKVEELRTNEATAGLVKEIEIVRAEGDAIADLMDAARELEEPQPVFFTRS
jgi:hypothetical protein